MYLRVPTGMAVRRAGLWLHEILVWQGAVLPASSTCIRVVSQDFKSCRHRALNLEPPQCPKPTVIKRPKPPKPPNSFQTSDLEDRAKGSASGIGAARSVGHDLDAVIEPHVALLGLGCRTWG